MLTIDICDGERSESLLQDQSVRWDRRRGQVCEGNGKYDKYFSQWKK